MVTLFYLTHWTFAIGPAIFSILFPRYTIPPLLANLSKPQKSETPQEPIEKNQKRRYPESFFSDASASKDTPSLQDALAPGVRIVTSDGTGTPKLILTVSGEMIRIEDAERILYSCPHEDFMEKIQSGEFSIEKPTILPLPSMIPLEANL